MSLRAIEIKSSKRKSAHHGVKDTQNTLMCQIEMSDDFKGLPMVLISPIA